MKTFFRRIGIIFLALLTMSILFFVGVFGTNIFMKYFVGKSKTVIVPSLQNLDLLSAQFKSKKNNFYVAVIGREYSNTVPNGKVISQSPRAGLNVKKFRTIEVVISRGSKKVRVPQLDNLSLVLAENKLDNLGLVVGRISRRFHSSIGVDKIISTKPPVDELVEKGTKIDIVISLGAFQRGSRTNRYQRLLE